MHVCVSEGCPLLLVTKRQHRKDRSFPRNVINSNTAKMKEAYEDAFGF